MPVSSFSESPMMLATTVSRFSECPMKLATTISKFSECPIRLATEIVRELEFLLKMKAKGLRPGLRGGSQGRRVNAWFRSPRDRSMLNDKCTSHPKPR